MNKNGRLTISEFFFFFSLIFLQYQIMGLSIPIWTGLIQILISIVKNKGIIKLFDLNESSFLPFWLFILVHEILGFIILRDKIIFNTLLEAIIAVSITLFAYRNISYNAALKLYSLVAMFASIFILYQAAEVYILGRAVSQIQLLPFLNSTNNISKGYRLCGIFSEPQAYATFVIPAIFMVLNEKKLYFAAYLSFTVLLSTSTLGVIAVGYLWVFYCLTAQISQSKKLLIIGAIILAALAFSSFSLFSSAKEKLLGTDLLTNARITQGFEIYSKLPDGYTKIVGICHRDLSQYIAEKGMILYRMAFTTKSYKWSYVTTISSIMIYYGFFGIILFLKSIVNIWKRAERNTRVYILLIVILSFGQTLLFNVWYILVYSMLFIFIREEQTQREEQIEE